MKKHRPKTTNLTAVVTAAILTGTVASAMAGQVVKKPEPTPTPVTENPLSLAGGVLTFDFQERIRWEARENNFDFNSKLSAANQTDDQWGMNRLRLGLTVKPNSWFKLYVQGQDSREFGSDRPGLGTVIAPGVANAPDGDNAFDIRQAYVEIADYKQCPWGLKIGRQVLSYGDERLVGGFEWSNFARTFDAAKLTYKGKGFSVDAFASSVVIAKAHQLDQSDVFNADELSRLQAFSGIYLTVDPFPFGTLDLYVFQLDSEAGAKAVAPTGTTGGTTPALLARSTDFTTFGTRVKGDPKKLGGWEYSGEFAYQTGSVQGLDLNAFAASVGGGYNFNAPMKPRVYVEYNYASGDKDAGDGSLGTFQNLFPTNHKFYGAMDVFSLQNLQNAMLSLRVNPTKTVTAQLDYNAFFAANTSDKLYRAPGNTTVNPAGAIRPGLSSYEGSELDVIVTWNAKKYLQIQGGYCYFVPGNYIKGASGATAAGANNQGAGHSDARFAYLQAMVTF